MLRSILRSTNRQSDLAKILLPAVSIAQLTSSRTFSAKKKTKPAAPAKFQQQANKNHSKKKFKKDIPEGEAKARGGGGDDGQANAAHELNNQIKSERYRSLAWKAGKKGLDVGPGGRSLFTNAASLSLLSRKDVNHYMEFSEEELRKVLPEGLC